MLILQENENSASGALSTLLKCSPIALKTFLKLCFPKGFPKQMPKKLEINHLHQTQDGREIDILLHNKKFGIIVECKVKDRKRATQFDPYIKYWECKHHCPPQKVVWLLQRREKIIGDQIHDATGLTWNQLYDALLKNVKGSSNSEANIIVEFCEELKRAKIVLEEGRSLERKKRHKGYDPKHAEYILNEISLKLKDHGFKFKGPSQENELSPRLELGKPSWSTIFSSNWTNRIWFYFQPEPDSKESNVKKPYFFRTDIVLFHSNHQDGWPEELLRAQEIATHLAKYDLQIMRNFRNKWSGCHSIPLKPPYFLEKPIRYASAKELPEAAMKMSGFDWKNDRAAIKNGAARVLAFAKKIESFNKD